ncbi:MAG TPA: ABC transporter permease [Bryobacteraceae bacterium]|nr:ABC transporter permease [Bryobacteraceae bacterium]
MPTVRTIVSRIRGALAGSRPDRELNAEIEAHLNLLAERFIARGLPPAEARQAARRQFGGIAQLQEQYRERRALPFLENFARDFAFSLRLIRKQPGFSLMVIGILALGLGANSAVFSLVNGILLRPLPFPHPENLVALFERHVINEGEFNPVAPANYRDWARQATTLDHVAAISYGRFNLSGARPFAAPERIDVCVCSASLFATLGIPPAFGRAFRPEEDRPGAPPVAVISHALWTRRFQASRDVLSGSITLDGRPYKVIGVMPAGFAYPNRSTEAWIPVAAWLPPVVLEAHDNHILTVIGRLRTGVSVAAARAEIDGIVRRYKSQHPHEIMGSGANVVPLAEVTVNGVRKLLLLLFGAVSCVLLIACVNVANLLLSRAAGRRREVAIRTALGAARGRVIRQLLIESCLLSLLGGLAGVLLAWELIQHLTSWAAASNWLPQTSVIRLDPAVFGFSVAVALVAGVLAGLFPALESTASGDIAQNLKNTGRSSTATRSTDRFREILVAAEVALSLILLVAAGLLIRSFGHLVTTDLGQRTSHRLTMHISLPDARYHERAQVSGFLKELSARLQSIPGVRGVGLSSCPVITLPGYCPDSVFQIENQPAPAGHPPDAEYRGVNPDFFRTAGIPILRGRAFEAADGIGVDDKNPHPGAAIINQSLARRFFPNQDPIGRYLTMDWFVGNNAERSLLRYRIVGVAGDVLERPQAPAQPTLYLPVLDGDSAEISIILNTGIGAAAVIGDARAAIHRIDPDLALFGVQSLAESLSETTRDQQFVMALLAAFAGMALLLAAFGLYGVVSWGVSQRAKEIAIRMALGASSQEVRRMVLWKGLRPALFGIAIGVPAAASIRGLIESFLFEVRTLDPATFIFVPLLLIAVTTAASLVPATRATRVDPTAGLRVD